MSSFIQTLRPSSSNQTRVLGLSEILPRISLIEEAIEGMRVLELGVQDVGSLLHLDRARPERIAGTSAFVAELDHSKLAGRRVELIHMDRGRLDFPSASFDVIVVNDLLENVEANAQFMNEVCRVLAPDGFCVLAFDARGHSVAELVSPEADRIRNAQPRKMVDMVRQHFTQIQFLEQTPFVGVALLSEDADPTDVPVSLDASLAGVGSKASHILALCGPVPPVGDQRTLVELPFHALEAEASKRFENTNKEVEVLEQALEQTRSDLQEKEASLRSIGARLKPLREAVVAKLSASSPPATIESKTRDAEIEELQFEIQSERARRRALEAELRSTKEEVGASATTKPTPAFSMLAVQEHNAELNTRLEQAQLENGLLQQGMLSLQRELELRISPPMLNSQEILQLEISLVASQNECEELQQRLDSAERQLKARISSSVAPRIALEHDDDEEEEAELTLWQRLAELEQERELNGRRILDLEDSHRTATTKFRELKENTDGLNLEKERSEATSRAKIAALVGALQVSETEVHKLRELLESSYESQSAMNSNSERALDEVENRFALEREIAGQMQVELDTVRREAFETRTSLENVQHSLVAKSAEFDSLRTRHTGAQADKAALELVSAQLTQELQTLREKYYALKSERDTLMATSRALIDERDVALTLADGVGESERRVRELTGSVEGGQAAIRRLEWEVDASQTEIRRLNELNEQYAIKQQMQVKAEESSAQRTMDLESSEQAARKHVLDLERRITQIQQHVSFLEQSESAIKDENIELERLVQDVSHEAMDNKRAVETYKERAEQLQNEVYESHEIIHAIQAEQMRLEAGLLDSESARQEAEARTVLERTQQVLLHQRLKRLVQAEADSGAQSEENSALTAEIQDLEIQLAGLLGAKEESELALGQTLQEAAGLVEQNQSLTRENTSLVEQLNQFVEAQIVLERAQEIILVLEESNAELHERLQLQQVLLEQSTTNNSSFAEVRILSDELEDLKNRVSILVGERDGLRIEARVLREEIAENSRLASEMETSRLEEVDGHGLALEEARTALGQSQERGQQLELMIAKYEKETMLLVEQMQEFERRAGDYDNQFREAQLAAMDALEELHAHESSLLDQEVKIERYQNEKTAMILRITSLEEEVETAHALKSEIGELKDVESELEQTREELAALTSSNSSLREAWESVSSELSDKVMSYEQAAMDARDREYNLQEELRRLTKSAVLSESQLRSEIQTSSHNERNAREIALEAQRKNAKGFKKITKLKTELKQAIEKLNAVSQKNNTTDHELQAKLKLAGQTINQLKRQKSEGSASINQVRAEMGHKMQEIRQLKAALIQTRKELAAQLESQKRLSAALKQSKSQNVSVENAREREQLIARFEAKTTTLETENHRLRQIAQKSESGLVEFELKISTLENTIMERNRQVELLRSEVADKAERLKRFSERLDKL